MAIYRRIVLIWADIDEKVPVVLDRGEGTAKISPLDKNAGIAQLVERNLAKVEVASSSLVSRSKC